MRDECRFCPMAEQCSMDCDSCDRLLDEMIENGRADYYKDWFTYIGEDADY